MKRAIVAGFARTLENTDVLLNNYIDSYQYKLPADYWDTYPARIEAITAADVQRVAQKYWTAGPAADRRGRGSRESGACFKEGGRRHGLRR